jgi:hypothetical protein
MIYDDFEQELEYAPYIKLFLAVYNQALEDAKTLNDPEAKAFIEEYRPLLQHNAITTESFAAFEYRKKKDLPLGF